MKLELKKILTNKKLISIVMAFFTFASLCNSKIIIAYNPLSWLVLFSLICLNLNVNIFNKINKREVLFLSILFSFLMIYGQITYSALYFKEQSIFKLLLSSECLYKFIGYFNIIYVILTYSLPRLISHKLTNSKSIIKKGWIVFFLSFLIISICWMPYFLTYYPGGLSPDSLYELETVINNFSHVSDHHPVIHMLFIAIPYKIGFALFGNITSGVAFSTLSQLLTMSLIFSSLILFLYNRKVNDFILLLVLLFYALLPMHGYYSITMWKDVIFAGLLLLLTMSCIKLIEYIQCSSISFKKTIGFIVISILCVFFRNNAIYMYLILALISLIKFKKNLKLFVLVFVIVFGTYFTIKGPVFDYLGITKSSSAEYIGMPLQQVGRMAFKEVEFTKREKKLIDKLMPLDIMKTAYNPILSDGIKFNSNYNITAFDENKFEYLKLWGGLVFKYPDIAIEAYSISTLGYWYPGVQYWSVSNGITENELSLYTQTKTSEKTKEILTTLESREFPILNMQWSIGLCFWTILTFAIISWKKKKKFALYPYIPVFGIWLTMMIASPVFGEFRYVYGAFTSLPLLMTYPYLQLKKQS